MKISHLINPKKCFASAAWMGNLYVCPKCGSSIACGANGNKYIFPPYNRYPSLLANIPDQPEWYFPDEEWEGVHAFMKETLASIGTADVDIDELSDDPEETEERC